jgi:hypothetical protein
MCFLFEFHGNVSLTLFSVDIIMRFRSTLNSVNGFKREKKCIKMSCECDENGLFAFHKQTQQAVDNS